MGRIPISIEKVKSYDRLSHKEIVKYLFALEEKGQKWVQTFVCDRDDLLRFRDEINKLVEMTTTGDVLGLTEDKAKIVDEHYKSDPICLSCDRKLTNNCKECLFVLQSPLERQLYLALLKTHMSFKTQYPLDWYGQYVSIEGRNYNNKQYNFKEILTVVDFYIERGSTRLCVYTDGHTYHERTEEQAQHDRNIDRKLQELGFKVLRYTGKDIKENIDKIITDIKKWINWW
ncbi:MAG: endonuclease domain-containing protein [Candidatus Azobacteroides sp.]|nr:endonuclease domain-containing protein [Candidatus Azobacteroides sp.]